jgi:diguanylate cyclase (GGDEF)-like protein
LFEVPRINKRFSFSPRIVLSKIAIYAVIPIVFVYLPFASAFNFSSRPFLALFIFYSATILILAIQFHSKGQINLMLRHECEDIENRLNLQAADSDEINRQNISLKENIHRYSSLEAVIESISRELNPDSVCDAVCSSAFSLVAGSRGTCAFFDIDSDAQRLRLHTTKQEDKKISIKAVHGDSFDHWVRAHMQPLLVEDINSDFRFDRERIKALDHRCIGSLISSPLVSGSTFLGILRLDHPDPGYYNLDDLRFLRSIGELGGVALENAQLYSRTQELAAHDGLTSVYTKGYFFDLLAIEIQRSRSAGNQFGLLMIDIDYFKKYNDTYGHIAGDIVLKSIAGALTVLLKDRGGIVCRFGGEEFCVILPGVGRSSAGEAAQFVCEAIARERFILRRKATAVTISIGLSVFPDSGDNETTLLMKADKAMYEAKAQGRNRVVSG